MINPIRMHGTFKEIEDAVFSMADGEVSQVIHAGNQYVILKREGLIPARHVAFQQMAPQLEEILRDQKMHVVAKEIFDRLQKEARGRSSGCGTTRRSGRRCPAWPPWCSARRSPSASWPRSASPGTASRRLEGLINRRILEQACRRQSVTVSEAEIDAEISRRGRRRAQAQARRLARREGLARTGHDEATHLAGGLPPRRGLADRGAEETRPEPGPSDRGRPPQGLRGELRAAGPLPGHRARHATAAQQVFEKARENNTAEHFGELAAQYSSSRAANASRRDSAHQAARRPAANRRGSVRPEARRTLRHHPGWATSSSSSAAKAAPNRSSPTSPKVREEIYRDVYEKKLHLAMAEQFDGLQEAAIVDNYLAGTSHSPKPSGKAAAGPAVPILRQTPAR